MTLTWFLASIVVIVLPLWFTIPWTYYVCWQVWWAYSQETIYVCAVDEHTDFYKEHETGHLIDDKYLTEEQREQYKKLYEKHRKIGLRAFQREYGYNDWQESLADDYASHVLKQKVNIYTKQRIKLITSFLK